VITLICPKCGDSEHFLQRVVEVWDYHFRASEDFECGAPYDEEWEDEVDWDESEFRDRQQGLVFSAVSADNS